MFPLNLVNYRPFINGFCSLQVTHFPTDPAFKTSAVSPSAKERPAICAQALTPSARVAQLHARLGKDETWSKLMAPKISWDLGWPIDVCPNGFQSQKYQGLSWYICNIRSNHIHKCSAIHLLNMKWIVSYRAMFSWRWVVPKFFVT